MVDEIETEDDAAAAAFAAVLETVCSRVRPD